MEPNIRLTFSSYRILSRVVCIQDTGQTAENQWPWSECQHSFNGLKNLTKFFISLLFHFLNLSCERHVLRNHVLVI